jgi:hypothetical protein
MIDERRKMVQRQILAAAALALGFLVIGTEPTRAKPFECPLPHRTTTADAVKESRTRMESIGESLIDDHSGNLVPEIAAELRRKHPKIGIDKTVNYIVSAYCAGLQARGIGPRAATKKARAFARRTYDRLAN